MSRGTHDGRRRISIYWTWSYPWEAQRDPAEMDNRFSTMTEVRNALWPSYETTEYDEAHFLQGIAGHAGTLPPVDAGLPGARGRGDRPSGGRVPAHRPGRLQAADRRADPRRHRHPDGLRARPPPVRAGSRTRGDRRDQGVAEARGHLPAAGAASRCGLHRRLRPTPNGVPAPRRPAWCHASSDSVSTRAP